MTPALRLHDVHAGSAPAWWPPAPGWWVALALVGIVLVLADPASAGTIPAQRWSQLAMHHEVIVLLLIDPLERMPPHARLPFVAAGGGRIELGLDAEDTRQRWHREFSGSVDATLADLHARGIRAVELSCADPGDAWLPLLDRGGRSR